MRSPVFPQNDGLLSLYAAYFNKSFNSTFYGANSGAIKKAPKTEVVIDA